MDTGYVFVIVVLLGMLLLFYGYLRLLCEEIKFLWNLLNRKDDDLNELKPKG